MASKPLPRKLRGAKQAAPRSSVLGRTREELREARETLDAIRGGHVDALVVQGPVGEQIFTLKGADHRYRQLVETMNEGALLATPSGTVVYCNARFAQLVGGALETIIGSELQRYVAPASRSIVDALVHTGCGKSAKAELDLLDQRGTPHPVYLSATAGTDDGVDVTCIIVTDLSDQKRSHEMLAADRLTAQIVDQAAQGIVVCDPNGYIVRASLPAHRLGGDNPLLRRFEDAFPLELRRAPDARTLVCRALEGETITDEEGTLRRLGADPVDLLLSAGRIIGDDEDILGCVITFTDITSRKRAAEERLSLFEAINSARIDAEAANRAKDDFLAMLGHELRNPLAPILTALELMNLKGEAATRREREIIERHVKHVVTLVGDLLDVARIARGMVAIDRRPVDLALVIDNAVEATSSLIEERRHRLELDVPAGLWVNGDEARLCQVFTNLLTNAARYTKHGGAIMLRAAQQGNDIVSVVGDTGVGIPRDLLPNLFDMFVQGKRTLERSEGGLGLGLSIVRSLVALHGGTVYARSAGPGLGSEFEVRLPAMQEVARDVDRAAAAVEPPVSKRVLVVDDNVDAAELLAEALESFGHQTRTAFDGPSAIAIAETFEPEIAVLDIGLPNMDGYELARRLHERHATTKLIAVTGYGRDTDQRRSLEAGFDDHLVKPIDIASLASTFKRFV